MAYSWYHGNSRTSAKLFWRNKGMMNGGWKSSAKLLYRTMEILKNPREHYESSSDYHFTPPIRLSL